MKKINILKGKLFWSETLKKIKKEFFNSLIKCIAWTAPMSFLVFSMGIFYNNVLYPDLKAKIDDIEIVGDKQILTEDNTQLPGRSFKINKNGEVENDNDYHAPVLEIKLYGKGKIGKAYIIYEENNDLLVQKINGIKNKLTGISVSQKLNVTINYSISESDNYKRAYLVLIDKKNNTKYIWCIYIDRDAKNAKSKSSDEIYKSMLYEDKDVFSLNKKSIQKEMTSIYKMNL